jgi:16S rRNA (guanine527-N7)-methyltransferase
MIFMKGPRCDDEIEQAGRTGAVHFRLAADHAYEIPGTPHKRRLVVYQRLETPAPARMKGIVEHAGFDHDVSARDISSESNPTYRVFEDLLTGRGVHKHGQSLISGERIIAEVLDRAPQRALAWITNHDQLPPLHSDSLAWYRLTNPLFRVLDVAGTDAPLLLVGIPPIPTWSDDDPWPDGVSLFIPFQNPENVGAVVRSAAAFGAARVILLQGAAHPFHPKSSRAAGSALFQIPLLMGPSIQDLGSRQTPLIALDSLGPPLDEAPFPARFGLVVGVEGPGLPERFRLGERRRIPIANSVESLNAATAAAVALYAWSRTRSARS